MRPKCHTVRFVLEWSRSFVVSPAPWLITQPHPMKWKPSKHCGHHAGGDNRRRVHGGLGAAGEEREPARRRGGAHVPRAARFHREVPDQAPSRGAAQTPHRAPQRYIKLNIEEHSRVILLDVQVECFNNRFCNTLQGRASQGWWDTRCLVIVFLETRSTQPRAWNPTVCVRTSHDQFATNQFGPRKLV